MKKDLTGNIYGNLTVIKEDGRNKWKQRLWLCRCTCGRYTVVSTNSLNSGNTKSCGIKHFAYTKDPLYSVWSSMKERCKGNSDYHKKSYADKGITVCDKWNKFINFYNDMHNGYKIGLQIDRIDNSKGYYRENCRWVTPKENMNNRDVTLVIDGVKIKEYCEQHNIKYSIVYDRIHKYHWDLNDALTIPKRGRRRA